MSLQTAIQTVNTQFVYKSDKTGLIDSWKVMKSKEGQMRGDCEDYSLTVMWLYSGKSLKKFIWRLFISRRYKLHRVKTINDVYHAVGEIDGYFFDNWSMRALHKEEFYTTTKHKHLYSYFMPFTILNFLAGFISR
jgi:hypothetical protein